MPAQAGQGLSFLGPGRQGFDAFGPGEAGFEVPAQAGQGLSSIGPGRQGFDAFGPGEAGFEVPAQAGQGLSVLGPGRQGFAAFGPGEAGFGALARTSQGYPVVGSGRHGSAAFGPGEAGLRVGDSSHSTEGYVGPKSSVTVWVDGLPRVAVMGPRGLEVGIGSTSGSGNPLVNQGQHPFVQGSRDILRQVPDIPRPPPGPPPPSQDSPLRFSPTTPNGTRVPKGPPPADCMEWPAWSEVPGFSDLGLGGQASPPPLPPELQTGSSAHSNEGQLKPEEPSRSVTDLPELPAFTPQEGSVLAGDWMTQLTPVVGTLSATSGVYWAGVLKEAYSLYSRWLAADPVQRLAVKAEANGWSVRSPRHVLIEQRLTVLLMRALSWWR